MDMGQTLLPLMKMLVHSQRAELWDNEEITLKPQHIIFLLMNRIVPVISHFGALSHHLLHRGAVTHSAPKRYCW